MAGQEKAGELVYEISADVANLLQGAKQATTAIDSVGSEAGRASDKLDGLDKAAEKTGKSVARAADDASNAAKIIERLGNEIAILEEESQNGSKSAAVLAAQIAASGDASKAQSREIGELTSKLYDMKSAQVAAARASATSAKQAAAQASDAAKLRSISTGLTKQIAVLSEEQKNGARSAAMLAARLQAGSSATAAQRREIGELAGKLYDLNKAQEQAARSAEKSSASGGRMEMALSRVGVAIAGAFTIQAAQKIISIADEMSILEARIKRLSPTVDAAKQTMSSLSVIASQTGNSLQDTERLWESMTTALKEAGATNGQILSLTSTLQKIGTIGGSSSQEMANALRQFGQSIAGGTIRAEEFNSIIEQMPELARTMAAGLGISIGELRKRMLEGKLTAEDALNAIMNQTAKVSEEFDKMPVSVERAKNSLDVAFKNVISDLNESIQLTQTLAGLMTSVSNNLNYFNKNVGDVGRMPKLLDLQKQYTEQVKEGQKWWETTTVYQQRVGQAAFELKRVEGEIRSIRAASAKEMESQSKISMPKSTEDSADVKRLEKSTKRKLELSKLEGEARARLQAQYDAEDAGITDNNRIKSLQDEYVATLRNSDARKGAVGSGKQLASTQDSINQKLEKLRQQSEVAAQSTAELSREQSILSAQQSLGKSATEEQIKLAGEYAAKAYDTAAALKAQALAEKQKQQVQKGFAAIQSQANPVSGLDSNYQQQLQTIEQYKQLYPQKIAEAEEARLAIEQQYREQRMNLMWEEWSQQSIATQAASAAFTAFGNNASNALTGIISGSMSASDALRSIGNTVLNSLVNTFVQMGVEWAKSAIMGATTQQAAIVATTAAQTAGIATTTAASTAAAGTTVAAWTPAATLTSIATLGGAAAIGIGAVVGALAMGLAGKRKNGGPVSAGSMYQVGEGGMPEIYRASNGSQYMIPGDNGKVISNKDMQGGGITIINNVENYSSTAAVDTQATSDGNGNVTIQTIVSDIANGGQISQAISGYHNAPRRARGG